jgi:uncharacterized membrane protein
MKKLLIAPLVLTLIFPAFCFASPIKAIPKNDKVSIDENLVAEIMWVLEDGLVEPVEIEQLIEMTQFGNPCETAITYFESGFVGFMVGMLFGGELNNEVIVMLLMLMVNAFLYCFAPNLSQG